MTDSRAGATLPAMIASMVALVVVPSAASGVRKVRISVPRIECLLDNRKYFLPGDLPAPAGEELRPMVRPKIDLAARVVKSDRPPGRPRHSRKFEDELAKTLGEPV